MCRIAVAGGTGAVGRTFVEALVHSQKHQVFVLSRSVPKASSCILEVTYLQTNYSDIDTVVDLFEQKEIDTILSAISIESEETSKGQLALIAAAEKASTVTRFIPSEYGFIATPEIAKLDPLVHLWIDNAETLERTNLKWTRIVNGFFLDYWGMPHIKTNLNPFPWAVDILNGKAAIPGTGEEVLTMTYSLDLANFIVQLLDEEEWTEFSILAGEDVTFNQIVQCAEKARGITFEVVYDDLEKLKAGQATDLGTTQRYDIQPLCSLFGQLVLSGDMRMLTSNRMNIQRFEPMTVTRMIKEIWTDR